MVDHVALAWVSSSPTAENARVATSSRLDAPRLNEWTTAWLSKRESWTSHLKIMRIQRPTDPLRLLLCTAWERGLWAGAAPTVLRNGGMVGLRICSNSK